MTSQWRRTRARRPFYLIERKFPWWAKGEGFDQSCRQCGYFDSDQCLEGEKGRKGSEGGRYLSARALAGNVTRWWSELDFQLSTEVRNVDGRLIIA